MKPFTFDTGLFLFYMGPILLKDSTPIKITHQKKIWVLYSLRLSNCVCTESCCRCWWFFMCVCRHPKFLGVFTVLSVAAPIFGCFNTVLPVAASKLDFCRWSDHWINRLFVCWEPCNLYSKVKNKYYLYYV